MRARAIGANCHGKKNIANTMSDCGGNGRCAAAPKRDNDQIRTEETIALFHGRPFSLDAIRFIRRYDEIGMHTEDEAIRGSVEANGGQRGRHEEVVVEVDKVF